MLAPAIRKFAIRLRHTPLHPQWLLSTPSAMAVADLADLNGRVLDIGCADRWVAAALNPDCEYIGLDFPATGRDLYHAHPNVFADASSLPFNDAHFDAVVMLEVVEHLQLPEKAISEAVRVLRPGGKFLLSMPFLYPIHDAPFDFQRYTPHGLKRELLRAGLRLRRIDAIGSALNTTGLLACLALAGGVLEAWEMRRWRLLWAPFSLAAIPVINLLAAIAGHLMPDWKAMSQGYWLVAEKPIAEA